MGDRPAVLLRELTKKHETVFRSTLASLLAYYQQEKPLGECVLVIEGRSRESIVEEEQRSWEEIPIEEHVKMYENQGNTRKEAMRLAAKDRGVSKRDIYQYLVNLT